MKSKNTKKVEEMVSAAERYIVTEGPAAGKSFTVLPWQKDVFKGMMKNTVLGVTMGRGCGKSTLLGLICAMALKGPLARPRGSVICTSATLEQSKLVGKHAMEFIRAHPDFNPDDWKTSNSMARMEITHKPSKSTLRCISSNVNGMHGLAAHLIVVDELAQIKSAREVLAVMRTTLGKQEDGKMVCIGTLPADRTNPFHQMCLEPDLDNGEGACVYQKAEASSIWSVKAIREANPSAKHFPVLMEAIKRERDAARKDPTLENAYRALRLNMGEPVVETDMFISVETYEKCLTKEGEHVGVKPPYIMGLDLGGSLSMTAAAAYGIESRTLNLLCCVGDIPTLYGRGKADRVGDLYLIAQQNEELMTTKGRVTNYEAFLDGCEMKFHGRPEVILCDRFRQSELLDVLDARGWGDIPVVFRGQGYKDGGEDMRDARRFMLDGKVRIPHLYLLEAAIRDAPVSTDPSGNSKLDKTKKFSGARDDALAATILALAEAHRQCRVEEDSPNRPTLRIIRRV